MTSKTRSFVLPIVSATATAFLAWGCERSYPRQICVGAADMRVADANCGRADGRYHWYYYPSGGGGAAGIGSRAYGGTYVRPSSGTFYAAPAEGVSRGGFGGIGRGGGGRGRIVQRRTIAPRRDWQAKVQDLGLVWHTAGGQPYWNEAAYYSFTLREVEEIEAATAALYDLMMKAGQAVIDRGLWARFAIPEWCAPLIAAAWDAEPPCLNHGRFDLAYDGHSPPKLLEFNCDTPTSLFEAAVVQWLWKDEVKPRADQFNSLHDKLVAKWTDIRPYLPPLVHFTHMADPAGEDVVTVAYLRDTAREAGVQSEALLIQDIGWDGRRFLDLQNRPIQALFHLYPWEWLAREAFGRNIAASEPTLWIEPIWKMMLSNKAVLPLLWELFPGHPNLLPAAFEPLRGDQVKKPILGREGANVSVIRGGRAVAETRGDYGEEGFVYQQYAPLPDFGGLRPVVGSWVVDGEPAGMGIREDGLITGNLARFVPHVIE